MDTSLIKNSTPPLDQHRAPGIVLVQSPRGALFLMSEAPLLRPREGGGGSSKRGTPVGLMFLLIFVY